MIIHLHMPLPQCLLEGMNIATRFEDRHGNHPPMYFARYSEDNTIRFTVLTNKDNRSLRRMFRGCGALRIEIKLKGGGSWEHCHMYSVAKHLFEKSPGAAQDVIHWLHNMLNYNYLQETRNHAEMASLYLDIVSRPNEPQS